MPIRSRALLLPLLMAITACAHHAPGDDAEARRWADARQLVLVITPGWDTPTGALRYFERDGSGWRQMGNSFDVTVGRTGTAWGIGLHAARSDGPVKREGDGKAPAGVFTIGSAFGYAASAKTGLAYQGMGANDWCIDVPESSYYNRIVDRSLVKAAHLDKSSEPMRRDIHVDGDQRYREGFVIEHNRDGAVANGGSCIFAHLWKAPGEATSGCTAMAPDNMAPLLAWLDARKHPVLVELPQAQYAQLRAAWNLPEIKQ
jgi:L,D-peptidoglycan transpeptidase YkuD (ErfK/YbiS/YcfS/YnhG family)